MQYHYTQFKNKLAAMTWDQLDAMFEQYVEIESRSVEDDNQHNAKLIAAAPDLLGILQIMAEKDFEFSEYECRLARAAIAKATGE